MNQDDYRIADRLPESLNRDNMRELAEAIDEKMAEIDRMSELVSIYPRIDELSSNLIDALAVQFHVDYYDKTLPLDTRRAIVRSSMRWHLRKGTKGVVQEMVQAVFESGAVHEWYEYGGNPYYFSVDLMSNIRITPSNLDAIVKAINMVKNVRSWLEQLVFQRRTCTTCYIGMMPSTHMQYTIAPATIHDSHVLAQRYIGASPYIRRSYQIYPRIVSDAMAESRRYYAEGSALYKKYTIEEE